MHSNIDEVDFLQILNEEISVGNIKDLTSDEEDEKFSTFKSSDAKVDGDSNMSIVPFSDKIQHFEEYEYRNLVSNFAPGEVSYSANGCTKPDPDHHFIDVMEKSSLKTSDIIDLSCPATTTSLSNSQS